MSINVYFEKTFKALVFQGFQGPVGIKASLQMKTIVQIVHIKCIIIYFIHNVPVVLHRLQNASQCFSVFKIRPKTLDPT